MPKQPGSHSLPHALATDAPVAGRWCRRLWRLAFLGAPLFSALLGLSSSVALAQENLLVNGSFEVPVVPPGTPFGLVVFGRPSMVGWGITQGTVDVNRFFWQSAPGQGRQSLDLVGSPGAGSINQTFPTDPGREYVFSGWVAHNPGVREAKAIVYLNDEFLTQLSHNVASNVLAMHWTFFAYRFHAKALTTTLTLTDVTGLSIIEGAGLDGLSVTVASAQEGLFQKDARLLVPAIEDAPNQADSPALALGQCATLAFLLRSNSEVITDVTYDPNTTFVTDPVLGSFTSKNVWCPSPAAVNKSIPVTARYRDARTGTVLTDTVVMNIHR
jgi:hypothetical protein